MATQSKQRNLGRLSEIAQVAVRHGFGYFFRRHRLTDLLPWGAPADESDETVSERGRRLREMLDELGPTFVKFAILSAVPMSSARHRHRTAQAPDDVKPFPFDQARAVIEAELDLTLE